MFVSVSHMNKSASRFIRRIGVAIAISVFVLTSIGNASLLPRDAAQKGRAFLADLLDPNLGLLPEYRGATVYWLFHDNYLAAKVLAVSHPKISQQIMVAIHREGVYKSGRMQAVF